MTEANDSSDHTRDLESALDKPLDAEAPTSHGEPAQSAPAIPSSPSSVDAWNEAEAAENAPPDRVFAIRANPSASTGAVERWAPYAAGALLAMPVLIGDYPPMTDLPLHETSVAILRHFGDTSMFPPGLYFHNFGHPNQLFHLAAWLLSYFVSTTLACKLVVAVGVAGLPIAAARLATHLGASRWTALIVAPIAVGWLFFMGLVANILGLTLLLALFPTLDKFLQKPTPAGAARAVGGAALLYFAHEAMMFDYAAAALLFTLGYPLKSRETVLRLSVFAASILITLAQLIYQAPLFTKSTSSLPTLFMPTLLKFSGMPGVLYGAYGQSGENRVLFGLALFAMIALAAQRWRDHKASGTKIPSQWQARLHAYRFEIFAACCFAAYVGYPVTLNGATLVYHRFLPPAFAVAAIVVSPRKLADPRTPFLGPRIYRLAAFMAAIIPLASLLIVWPAFADQGRNYRDVGKLIPFIAKGSAIAAIASDTTDNHGFVRPTMAIRAVADRGGRMLYSFSESPIAPVMIDKRWEWAEPIERIIPNENNLCPAYDFTRFRYLLFHSTDVQLEYIVSQSLKPEAKLVESAGEWSLYESTLPLVPLETPEGAAPAKCPHGSLGTRMQVTSTELRDLLSNTKREGAITKPQGAPPIPPPSSAPADLRP